MTTIKFLHGPAIEEEHLHGGKLKCAKAQVKLPDQRVVFVSLHVLTGDTDEYVRSEIDRQATLWAKRNPKKAAA